MAISLEDEKCSAESIICPEASGITLIWADLDLWKFLTERDHGQETYLYRRQSGTEPTATTFSRGKLYLCIRAPATWKEVFEPRLQNGGYPPLPNAKSRDQDQSRGIARPLPLLGAKASHKADSTRGSRFISYSDSHSLLLLCYNMPRKYTSQR